MLVLYLIYVYYNVYVLFIAWYILLYRRISIFSIFQLAYRGTDPFWISIIDIEPLDFQTEKERAQVRGEELGFGITKVYVRELLRVRNYNDIGDPYRLEERLSSLPRLRK